MATTLKTLKLKGWKSIRDAEITLGRVNVLIGANGSGKSNLVSFFQMLGEMAKRRLGLFIGKNGGAAAHLFYGPKETPVIEADLDFDIDGDSYAYMVELAQTAQNQLIIQHESLYIVPPERAQDEPQWYSSNHSETGLHGLSITLETHRIMLAALSGCRVYQFHDTTAASEIRRGRYINDSQQLHSNGSNVAAVLRRLRQESPIAYQRIVSAIRLVAPYFDDFALSTSPYNEQEIVLDWKEVGSDIVFGAYQLSDGTLRFIALATLLLQPTDLLPTLIIIDEPELGLHPHAIGLLAAMVRQASVHSQVILATQSPILLDHFGPEDTIVADRKMTLDGRRLYESTFHRLSESDLEDWLADYSLSELWEKNVIGGGPY